ncbi:MAG TPA: cytochrome c biogenesis protein ResB, partial [Bacteroidales bacterium]|nr:cytochrome c biogenesis protein ResB [Bacteroidales bacterium]
MKKALSFLFSTSLMAVLILLFAFSIAVATFIENDFGTQTARAAIYNAWWFNLLLFTGIFNLTGTIIINRLYRKEKRSIFTFHLAFLLILTGAAITRFFGFEGYMHIREGDSSNRIISSDNYFMMSASSNGEHRSAEKKIYFSKMSGNYNKLDIKIDDQIIRAECLEIIPDAIEVAIQDASGKPVVELVVSATAGRQTVVITQDGPRIIGNLLFTLNDSSNSKGVDIQADENELKIKSPIDVTVMDMATQQVDTLETGGYHPLKLMSLYNLNGLMMVPRTFFPAGKLEVKTDENSRSEEMPDAVLIRISSGNGSRTLRYFAYENALNEPVNIVLNDVSIDISYGSKMVPVPFELMLTEFLLERYPGSNSPSSFESKIILTDHSAGIRENRRVYMNNVLKHKGYRFYQSSYDTDEKGTVFSVNRDYAGTFITYAGYLLLAAGIVFSLMNRNSRFRKLSAELDTIRQSGKQVLFSLLLLFSAAFPFR